MLCPLLFVATDEKAALAVVVQICPTGAFTGTCEDAPISLPPSWDSLLWNVDLTMDAAMPNASLPRARVPCVAMLLLALVGCTATPSEPAPKLLTAEEAAARTVVPLTRPIALDKAGKVVDMEFDLPPAGPGTVPDLMLGLRVWGIDAKAMLAQQSRIDVRPFATLVHLQRLDGDSTVETPLNYTSRDRRTELSVGPDGAVPFTTVSSVAQGAVRSAGLVDERRVYGVVRIAEASRVESGRYRLLIELPSDRPDLQGLNVELLLGYGPRSK
ncbi:hypothetical protein [Stenotrophomonas indicatrix]|uniref:hypothetical protein n=2 Tax=Stenotrophomonas indicatrix TaxID=2045451 RepID=UPI000FD8777B|nr:hypothetical protein [Stenotrophomonas indicatrix]